MALNQWSKRSLFLVAAICAVGGFLAGSSSSQDVGRAPLVGEVGRYQMVHTNGGTAIIDTKTARFWERTIPDGDMRKEYWDEHAAPWDKRRQ